MEKQFAPNFTAQDLASIDNFNAYIKMLVNGRPVEPFDIRLMSRQTGDQAIVETAKELSSQKYGRNKEEVETAIMTKYRGVAS